MSSKIKILIIISFLSCFLFFSQAEAADTVNPIYSMAVSGNVKFDEIGGYARIILTDTSGNEYLMYEAQGPFDSGSFSFENTCEETCVLNGIVPKKVHVEVLEAEIYIDKLFMIEDRASMDTQVQTMGMQTYREALDPIQEDVKIDKMNKCIQNEGMEWTAGKTSVSSLSYAEKKKVFGSIDALPNLEGFEYYKGGVFETSDTKALPKSSSSNFPESFDWRNRHGENWMTPVKDQGTECSSCWAFASTGAIEAVTNLYFNEHLDINLSEQELVSCLSQDGCNSKINRVWPRDVIKYCENSGIVTEDCFPYSANNISCNRCNNYQQQKINSSWILDYTFPTDERLKKGIIKYGPMGCVSSESHAMTLVGWDTSSSNETIWIFKNTMGLNHGAPNEEQGYVYVKGLNSYFKPTVVGTPIIIADDPHRQIKCVDKDGDGYCNWGISQNMPSSCNGLNCKPKEDCDDSNSKLGPFDSSFNCSTINGSTPGTDTIAPSVGTISPSSAQINVVQNLSVNVSDNIGVDNCKLFIDGSNKGTMNLSSTPCQSCTASKFYTFTNEKNYSAHAKCWDAVGNMKNGSSVNILVSSSAITPDCSEFKTDLNETPPKCEKDCGANSSCDENAPNAVYSSINDNCSWCDSYCRSYSDLSINKGCVQSKCTVLGWNNSKCVPAGNAHWVPCDPTSGWKCFEKEEGDASCPGQSIYEGTSRLIYGYVACEKGETAVDGVCRTEDNETIEISTSQIAMIPSPKILNNTVTFEPFSAWHCRFREKSLFNSAEGCGWAKCETGEVEGINNIKKIEFKIFRHFFLIGWYEMYGTTVFNQNTIAWNGKGNKGKDLPNHLYTYAIKITLNNGATYRTEDKIRIQR